MPGSHHDPLSYLSRLTVGSKKLTPDIKKHIEAMIRRYKKTPFTPANMEQRIGQHISLFSYAHILRLEKTIDDLEPSTKGFKDAVYALSKLTTTYRVNLGRVRVDGSKRANQPSLKAPPTRGTE